MRPRAGGRGPSRVSAASGCTAHGRVPRRGEAAPSLPQRRLCHDAACRMQKQVRCKHIFRTDRKWVPITQPERLSDKGFVPTQAPFADNGVARVLRFGHLSCCGLYAAAVQRRKADGLEAQSLTTFSRRLGSATKS